MIRQGKLKVRIAQKGSYINGENSTGEKLNGDSSKYTTTMTF